MTINIRCSRFRAANAPLRRTVYHRKALSVRDKITVFESLAVSVLLTNSGAWLPLRHQQNCKIDAAHRDGIQAVVRPRSRPSDTDSTPVNKLALDEAHLQAGTLPASVRIRLIRLRMLPRIIVHAPLGLRMLLDANTGDRTWADAVDCDRRWLLSHCHNPPAHLCGDFRTFLRSVALDTTVWLNLCLAGGRAAKAVHLESCRIRRWRQDLVKH